MSQGDRTAARIGAPRIGTGLGVPRTEHRREGLVDLEGADLVEAQPGARQHLGRRGDRSGQHDHGIDPHEGDGVHPGPRRQPQLTCLVRRREQEGRGSVRDLRGIARRDDAVLLEHGPQASERLDTRAASDALVLRHLTDRGDLGFEQARVRRLGGTGVRLRRQIVEVGPRQSPLSGDHLGGDTLVDQSVVIPLEHQRGEGAFTPDGA